MRAWRHRDPGLLLAENALEFANKLRIENVLYHVRITVYVTGGDVGMGNEVSFPETVVASDAGGLAEACFAEKDGSVGAAFKMF